MVAAASCPLELKFSKNQVKQKAGLALPRTKEVVGKVQEGGLRGGGGLRGLHGCLCVYCI